MKYFLLLLTFILGIEFMYGQVPEKMSYQAIIRNSSGQILSNQIVSIKASIIQGSSNGNVVFSEHLSGTTNVNGLFTSAIGSGTALIGSFNSIDWSLGNYYLKTETDPTGGTNYTIAGTSELLSVPYAMYAKSSGSSSGGNFTLPYIANETNTGTLFSLSNNGDGTSIEGINKTNTSSISAVRGVVESTSPGGFSTGVRGMNKGTGGLGIGVWGSHDGSGWGVYGVTPNGLGVYGNSSGNGTGVYANSNTGVGLTATSNNGVAANISIYTRSAL